MKFFRDILIPILVLTTVTAGKENAAYNFYGEKYFTNQMLNEKIDLQKSVEDNISALLDFYIDKGFPFVKIKIDSLKSNDVFLTVSSGEFVSIDEIIFDGVLKTDQRCMLTQSRLKIGERFSENGSKEASEWIYMSGLFENRPDFEIFKRPDQKFGLKYSIKEKKYNEIVFLGGYSSKEDESALSFLTIFNADNLFGTMRRVKFMWERSANYSEEFKLYYKEPFLAGLTLSTEAELRQIYKKEIFLKRSVYVGQKYSFDPRSGIKYGYLREYYYPDTLYLPVEREAVTTKYKGGIEYSQNENINPVPSEKGFSIEAEIASVNINIESMSDLNGLELYLKPGYTFEINRNVFIDLNVNYEHVVFKEDIPDFGKILFGGSESFRGYREDFFTSDIFLLNSSDIYFVAQSGDIAFKLFSDVCAYNASSVKIAKIRDLSVLYSYGGGLIYQTGSGQVSLTVGVPHENGFAESVIHVKYSFRF